MRLSAAAGGGQVGDGDDADGVHPPPPSWSSPAQFHAAVLPQASQQWHVLTFSPGASWTGRFPMAADSSSMALRQLDASSCPSRQDDTAVAGHPMNSEGHSLLRRVPLASPVIPCNLSDTGVANASPEPQEQSQRQVARIVDLELRVQHSPGATKRRVTTLPAITL
jgi:hypothetical protein